MKIAVLLNVLAFLLVSPSFGQKAFTATIGSVHYATEESKNELNPGFIITNSFYGPFTAKWGAFKNSQNKGSLFFAYGPEFSAGSYFRGFVGASVATGYGTLATPLKAFTFALFPAVSLSVGPKAYSLEVVALPGAVGLGATIRF